MNTIKDLWIQYFPAFEKVSLSPESDFRWLMESVTGDSQGILTVDSEKQLEKFQVDQAKTLLDRRVMGEPVAYILGEWDFYGRTFSVGEGVLIPRPETELIVDLYKRYFQKDQRLKIADLGSGSGCLAITLALESPGSHVTAVEFSEAAFEFLKENIERHGLHHQSRFVAENLDAGVWCDGQSEESFDLIVANPPYIDESDARLDIQVRESEPHEALFSGENGFQHFRQWSEKAARILSSGGVFLCELGEGQDQLAVSHVTSLNVFGTVEVEPDFNGIPRTVIAVKN